MSAKQLLNIWLAQSDCSVSSPLQIAILFQFANWMDEHVKAAASMSPSDYAAEQDAEERYESE